MNNTEGPFTREWLIGLGLGALLLVVLAVLVDIILG
jgi:hypothetical protein